MRDPRVEEYVRAKVRAEYEAIDRHLPLEISKVMAQMAARNVLQSSMTVRECAAAHEDATGAKIRARIEAEREAHRRLGLEINELEVSENILPELLAIVETDVASILGEGSRIANLVRGERWEHLTDEIRDRLSSDAHNEVAVAAADSRLPQPAAGGDVFNIQVIAPNQLVVAQNVGAISQGPTGEELRSILGEALDAAAKLSEIQAAEARDLLNALATEARRPQEPNSGLLRGTINRLRELLQLVDGAEKVVALLARVPSLIEQIKPFLGP